jgi:hypothetical protein
LNVDELSKALQNLEVIQSLVKFLTTNQPTQFQAIKTTKSGPTKSSQNRIKLLQAKKNENIRSQNKAKMFEEMKKKELQEVARLSDNETNNQEIEGEDHLVFEK